MTPKTSSLQARRAAEQLLPLTSMLSCCIFKGTTAFPFTNTTAMLRTGENCADEETMDWSTGTILAHAWFEPVNQQKYPVRRQLILFAILF